MSLVVSLRLVLIFVRRHVSPASHRCKCRAIFYGALWQEMAGDAAARMSNGTYVAVTVM